MATKKEIKGVRFAPAFSFYILSILLFTACPREPGVSVDGPPPVPEGLVAESGDGMLYVRWRPATGAAEYRVYCDTGETPSPDLKLTTSAAAGVITGLTNGIEYTVRVRAVNSAGESGFSPPVTGRPLAGGDFVPIPGKTVTGSAAYAFTVTVPTVPSGYTNAGTSSLRKGVFVEGRSVTIDSFVMAKYETTQDLWFTVQAWALGHGYYFQNPKSKAPIEADRYKPAAGISWRDAIVWCNAYSEMTGREPVYTCEGTVIRDSRNANTAACDGAEMNKTKTGFRLPTEAEREFAARGGDPGLGDWLYMYAGSNNPDEVAWHHGNAAYQTRAVGTKTANRLGVYDLSGNVQEWCWDWMNWTADVTPETPADGAAYSKTAPPANQKAFNGGGVGSNTTMSCVTYRWGYSPDYKDNYIGFRVARKP
jgi:formylglycine-generating enzyme required for sulfatase activity